MIDIMLSTDSYHHEEIGQLLIFDESNAGNCRAEGGPKETGA